MIDLKWYEQSQSKGMRMSIGIDNIKVKDYFNNNKRELILLGSNIDFIELTKLMEAKAIIDRGVSKEEVYKTSTLLLLDWLCDTKTQEAKNYINGSPVSNEQLDRYHTKYIISNAYKADGSYKDQLQLEADLKGITVDELADLVIKMGNAYKEGMTIFNSRIEAFRVKTKSLIDADNIEKVRVIISHAKDLATTSTDDDIKKLFD